MHIFGSSNKNVNSHLAHCWFRFDSFQFLVATVTSVIAVSDGAEARSVVILILRGFMLCEIYLYY